MIVRVSSEGQYEVSDETISTLNELDNTAVKAVHEGDWAGFEKTWAEMLDLIDAQGRRLPADALVGSDMILPPRDISFDEAEREFTGEGLIPN